MSRSFLFKHDVFFINGNIFLLERDQLLYQQKDEILKYSHSKRKKGFLRKFLFSVPFAENYED